MACLVFLPLRQVYSIRCLEARAPHLAAERGGDIRGHPETLLVHRGCIGIMEKKMETIGIKGFI